MDGVPGSRSVSSFPFGLLCALAVGLFIVFSTAGTSPPSDPAGGPVAGAGRSAALEFRVVGAKHRGVRGAKVELLLIEKLRGGLPPPAEAVLGETTTDHEGRARFPRVALLEEAPGGSGERAEFRFRALGVRVFHKEWHTEEAVVQLGYDWNPGDELARGSDVETVRGAVLRLRFLSPAGDPIPGARIRLYAGDGTEIEGEEVRSTVTSDGVTGYLPQQHVHEAVSGPKGKAEAFLPVGTKSDPVILAFPEGFLPPDSDPPPGFFCADLLTRAGDELDLEVVLGPGHLEISTAPGRLHRSGFGLRTILFVSEPEKGLTALRPGLFRREDGGVRRCRGLLARHYTPERIPGEDLHIYMGACPPRFGYTGGGQARPEDLTPGRYFLRLSEGGRIAHREFQLSHLVEDGRLQYVLVSTRPWVTLRGRIGGAERRQLPVAAFPAGVSPPKFVRKDCGGLLSYGSSQSSDPRDFEVGGWSGPLRLAFYALHGDAQKLVHVLPVRVEAKRVVDLGVIEIP